MPRFYFDIRENGVLSADDSGVDLPSVNAARGEAQRTLAEMMTERMRDQGDFKIVIEIRVVPSGAVVEAVASATMRDVGN